MGEVGTVIGKYLSGDLNYGAALWQLGQLNVTTSRAKELLRRAADGEEVEALTGKD